jgi:hypothetical protein
VTVRLLTPLPLRTRLRLRTEHHVDTLAYQLIGRQHHRTAMWLWRTCRML